MRVSLVGPVLGILVVGSLFLLGIVGAWCHNTFAVATAVTLWGCVVVLSIYGLVDNDDEDEDDRTA